MTAETPSPVEVAERLETRANNYGPLIGCIGIYTGLDAALDRQAAALLRDRDALQGSGGVARAPRPYPHWNGAGKVSEAFIFEGGSLTINTSGYDPGGDGHFVFAEDDAEWEQDEESPKVYRIVNVSNSELIFIRDKLNEVFPPPSASDSDLRERVRSIVDDAVNSAIPEPWEVIDHATDRLIALLSSSLSGGSDAHLPKPRGEDAELVDLDLEQLDRWFALIPPGPYDALHHTNGWEVRQLDTDPTNKHHWPFRLCESIAGQSAGCDEAVFSFIAGVLNAWPLLRDRDALQGSGEATPQEVVAAILLRWGEFGPTNGANYNNAMGCAAEILSALSAPPPPSASDTDLRERVGKIADRIEDWVKYDPDPAVFGKVARELRALLPPEGSDAHLPKPRGEDAELVERLEAYRARIFKGDDPFRDLACVDEAAHRLRQSPPAGGEA